MLMCLFDLLHHCLCTLWRAGCGPQGLGFDTCAREECRHGAMAGSVLMLHCTKPPHTAEINLNLRCDGKEQ